MDFRLADIVHPPLVHVHRGCELRLRGRGGYSDLKKEGILPPKGILMGVHNRLEPCENIVRVSA